MPTTRTVICLQMPYNDSFGGTDTASVWMPSAEDEDIIDEQGGIPWLGFETVAALQAHDQPVGNHLTAISKAAFVAGSGETDEQVAASLGMPTANITEAMNTAYLCISLAMATLDVAGPPNADGTAGPMVSYFQGATITTVQVTDQ